MAVIVKYIVVRNGIEKMTFTNKKEADAYDRQLDISENLFTLLESANLKVNDDALEEISFFIAQHSDDVIKILKGAKSRKPAAPTPAKPADAAAAEADVNTQTNARPKSKPKAKAL